MKKRFLRLKTAMRAVMLILIMGVVGVTEGFAQNFSVEYPSGQTLYYQITDNENHYVTVVSPAFGIYNLNGEMTIPDVVTYGISYKVTGIGDNAFSGCTGLTSVKIPNSVTSIGECAFYQCTGLASVEIPNSVKSIGNSAFSGCTGLTSLTIGNSVTSIGGFAFIGCSSVTSLTIPNSVTSIGDHAFNRCAGLTSLTIGSNVKTIEVAAFADCIGLSMMMVKASEPPTLTDPNVFDGVTSSIQIYVPYGSIDKYKEAPGWNNFIYQPMAYTEIKGYGESSDHWVFIASPLLDKNVPPTAVDGLVADPAKNYDLYRFNQSGKNGEWENYKNIEHTGDFVLDNGKGYLYANMNDVTLTFVGDMNTTSPQIVGLDYDDRANLPGWNLIGNPFTEDASINRSYYKMNATGTDVEPAEASTPVAAYSGIMVQANGDDDYVTFTKSRSKSSDNGGLQITLSKTGVRGDEAQDKVIVSFNKYAQLSKFIFNEDNAKLYIPMGGEDYAIAYSDRQSNMPLYFKTKEMGIYTMSFEGAIDNIKIIDNLDGSVIDLNAEKSFTFVGTPSDRNDRFTIVFNTPATEDFAYQSGDGIVVNGEGELQVFDIMGRMVAKYYVNGVETVNIPCQSGVYVLRLLGKETNTQKIVVK